MKLPILMYHYVRPNGERLSNRHNVLDLKLFDHQLDVMASKYEFVNGNDLLALDEDSAIAQNKIWLTFDDGYRDCIDHVLPSLIGKNATGTFYIPTEAIFERKLLDVNKIHILLSSCATPKMIVEIASNIFADMRIESTVKISFEELFLRFGVANPWNDGETEFIKKLFQKLIPTKIRKSYLSRVFEHFVDRSESSWVDEFYLSPDDVQILVNNGMEIGSHSHSHEWLAEMTEQDQRDELNKSFALLGSVIGDSQVRSMCYPFGSYNNYTLNILRDLDVQTGVINRQQSLSEIDLNASEHLELDRIDIMFFDKFMNGDFN